MKHAEAIKRKKNINRIRSILINFSKQFKRNVKIDPDDTNHNTEEAFCHLLNSIYGWNLKFEAHRQTSYMPFYLIDSERGICVQISCEVSNNNKRVLFDNFLANCSLDGIKKRILIILSDERIDNRIFQSGNSLVLDDNMEILSFGSLCDSISILNTQEIKTICSHFNSKLCKRIFPDLKPLKSAIAKCCTITLAVSVMLIIAVWFKFSDYVISQNTPASSVLTSYIFPYEQAGVYESYDDISPIYKTELETINSFSILSFIRPNDSADTIIENQSCHILNLDPIEHPEIHIDGAIVGDRLLVFAFNNGWETATALSIESVSLGEPDSEDTLAQIANHTEVMNKVNVPPASAVLLAEYSLDRTKFQKYCELHANSQFYTPQLFFSIHGRNCSAQWYVLLYLTNDEFVLDFPGIGGPPSEYNITLFAVLDVDSHPKHIIFSGATSNPRINEDILRIETVIAPTKSCIIKCRNEFTIDGKIQQTPDYTVTVTVPALAADDLGRSSPLARELANLEQFDEISIRNCIEKYRYNPESIFEDHNG